MHAPAPNRYVGPGDEDPHRTCQDFLLPLPSFGGEIADLNKQCPAVIPSCLDPSCVGDPNLGCSNPGATMGCNCTGAASFSTQQPPASQKNATVYNPTTGYTGPGEACPPSISCASSSCQSNAVGGGLPPVCSVQPFKGCHCQANTQGSPARCPADIQCGDPRCEGGESTSENGGTTSGNGGTCYTEDFSGCSCSL